MSFDALWLSIIRPPRQSYFLSDLGPPILPSPCHSVIYKRIDLTLSNLECSYYHPLDPQTRLPIPHTPYILYLHSNTGSRVEALSLLQPVISYRFGLFTFDFTGSGLSKGKYISLGFKEMQDVEKVVIYMREKLKVEKLVIWGRSMGATTGLLYASKHSYENIVNLYILDSPFYSLKTLIEELAVEKTGLPLILLKALIAYLNNKIKGQCGWGFENIDLEGKLCKIKANVIIMANKKDSIVKWTHIEKVIEGLRHINKVIEINKAHNENRGKEDIGLVFQEIMKNFDRKYVNFNDKYHLFKEMGRKKEEIEDEDMYIEKSSDIHVEDKKKVVYGEKRENTYLEEKKKETNDDKSRSRSISKKPYKIEKKVIIDDILSNSNENEAETEEQSFKKPTMTYSNRKKYVEKTQIVKKTFETSRKKDFDKENVAVASFSEFFSQKQGEYMRSTTPQQHRGTQAQKKNSCSTTPNFKSKLMKILHENKIVNSGPKPFNLD